MLGFLETLEPRIAPAVITIGPSSLENGTVTTGAEDYTVSDSSSFQNANEANSALFAPNTSGDPGHFYLDLKAGDKVRLLSDLSSPVDFIKVSAGRAYAFFFDSNNNNTPEANELTGMVASSGANIAIFGDLNGSFLANLDAKTGQFSETSLVTSSGKTSNIASLKVTGNVGQESGGSLSFGNILAGGNIASVSAGRVNTIQSGTPSASLPDVLEPVSYHLGGAGQTQGQGTINVFQPVAKTAGGSLSNVTVNSADAILAGPGFAGGSGGKISNVKIIADPDGIVLRGGAGGDGASLAGGAGGLVSQVVMAAVPASTPNALVKVLGGQGGESTSAAGGAGGSVANIWVGYQYDSAQKLVVSPDLLASNVLIAGGEGGVGKKGGVGGSLKSINIVAAPPEDSPTDDPSATPEIRLLGGNGGLLTAQGTAAGAGGSVSNFKIQNLDADAGAISDVLVKGGDASSAAGVAAGVKTSAASGGSITNPVAQSNQSWLVAQSIAFEGGAGSSTSAAGGAGGSVSNLYFGFYANQYLSELSVLGGNGGDASLGSGGAGGKVSGVYVPIAELSRFEFSGGAGGDGSVGNGGAGGTVGSAQIFDISSASTMPIEVNAGNGGTGSKVGGAGGGISNISYFGFSASMQAQAGVGGNGESGGGLGGSLKGIAFSSSSPLLAGAVANLFAGNGGSALTKGSGGKGGGISAANVQTSGDVELRAGVGGNSAGNGTPGAGGAIGNASSSLGVFARSAVGSVFFQAADAGSAGSLARVGAAGGNITNAVGSGAVDLSFVAGQGSAGGAGGSISRIGFYGVEGLGSSFNGNLQVKAGDGGDPVSSAAAGGAGGSISTALGSVSGTAAGSARFEAGTGGGEGAFLGTKGGKGGSISRLNIVDGASSFSVVAGHGGQGTSAGGAGGNVQKIAAVPAVVANVIAAGDGGDASASRGKGGSGGSVTKVDLAGDLGVRSGASYGFAVDGSKAGGLFVGVGGTNTASPSDLSLAGTNGNATNITAEAISSIVAGRGSSPFLAGTVSGVYLRGNTAAQTDASGAFLNFDQANLVGSKLAPSATSASDFHYVGGTKSSSDTAAYLWSYGTDEPVDGLIAATKLTDTRNFLPLAFLTNTAPAKQPAVYSLFVPVPLKS